MNVEGSMADVDMRDCSHPKADTRIILHVLNCLQSGTREIYVRTNDTDVVVLLVAYMPNFVNINNNASIVAVSGVGSKTATLSINAIACYVGSERCKEMFFLHSLSGSDYTSSFFHIGKVKFWNAWSTNRDISKTFLTFSDCLSLPLSDDDVQVVEKFYHLLVEQ